MKFILIRIVHPADQCWQISHSGAAQPSSRQLCRAMSCSAASLCAPPELLPCDTLDQDEASGIIRLLQDVETRDPRFVAAGAGVGKRRLLESLTKSGFTSRAHEQLACVEDSSSDDSRKRNRSIGRRNLWRSLMRIVDRRLRSLIDAGVVKTFRLAHGQRSGHPGRIPGKAAQVAGVAGAAGLLDLKRSTSRSFRKPAPDFCL